MFNRYQRVADIQPGFQWNDAGGYCGSWATQRAVLAKGAWISQQQVRDHTRGCGGHDSEILSCNIDEAWTNLKIDYEAFAYDKLPVPQTDAFGVWLKQQLAAGHVVAWMIMWNGQTYPIYDLTPPAGMYGHIEPVIGIQSSHPLNDSAVYDDDVVLHFTDGGSSTVHRTISSLPCKWPGANQPADCNGCPCRRFPKRKTVTFRAGSSTASAILSASAGPPRDSPPTPSPSCPLPLRYSPICQSPTRAAARNRSS